MPITRKQFELGIDAEIESYMKRIHDFLAQHRDEAFTLSELGQALGVPLASWLRLSSGELAFLRAVDKLVEAGAVATKHIENIPYHAWRAPLET